MQAETVARGSSSRSRRDFSFGTKAETLARLAPLLETAVVMPRECFSEGEWSLERDAVLDRVFAREWGHSTLIVRSSCRNEDTCHASNAGRYHSELGVHGRTELETAIERVLASYDEHSPRNEVLVQPQLQGAVLSGVASSCEATSSGPYRVVSWCDGPDTTAVTLGTGRIRTWYCLAYRVAEPPRPALRGVLQVVDELETLIGSKHFELEFAVAGDGAIVLFQVRPLAGTRGHCSIASHRAAVAAARKTARSLRCERPPALGRETVLGIMPDWNPAEMIGVRPRPLALSLYRALITDSVWARARMRYGYRDVRGVPLLVDLAGLPYVDVRASFTSFVPRDLDDGAAARLVEHYLETLRAQPHLHDKIEFEIALSSYDLSTPSRAAALVQEGVLALPESAALVAGLRGVLQQMLDRDGQYRQDLATVRLLELCGLPALSEGGSPPERVTALLDRCRRYGTLPFAGLARAAFTAVALVKSLVASSVLSLEDGEALLGSANAVSATLRRDFATLDQADFLRRYGYLRPGTYDILSPRYDETSDRYFDWSTTAQGDGQVPEFRPTRAQLRRLQRALDLHALQCDAATLLEFVRESVAAREYAKAQFSRLLSEVLVEVRRLGEDLGFDAEDMSCAMIDAVRSLSGDPRQDSLALLEAIEEGRRRYAVTETLCAPALLVDPSELTAFVALEDEPNFVTHRRVLARVADADSGAPLRGAIVLARSADPGYDWIFTHGIAGLITAYGGANSHMALRALELGIPAVIGAGELRFERWLRAGMLEVDAGARTVRPVVGAVEAVS
jgi:glutamine kinase